MSIKWTDILKYTSGGVLSLALLLAGISNLTGMSFSSDGDKVCTDCFSEITVNSTYWNICTEHAGTKDAVFRKSTSPVLYINLDKIEEIAATEPKLKVDLLVKTTKSNAEFTTEYGYLRKAKDGDCIIKRYSKKSNPNPSKFYLHGRKEATERVKWSFELRDPTVKDIIIDPVWLPDTNFSWICDYKTTQIADNKKVFKGVTYEFTCPIGQNISVNTTKKFAICYNPGILHPNGSYTYSVNFSHFYDKAFLANRTMYWNETELDYEYVDFQNTTTCEKAGFTIGDLRINYTKCGVQCSWDNPIASCDICEGDSNCDGIYSIGESGFSKDISEENITFAKIKQWWRVDNGNNNLKEQLKNCVEKI